LAHASGVYSAEASAGLLIRHRRWLDRRDFVEQFVTMADEEDGVGSFTPMAAIDWPAAVAALEDGLPCSSGDEQVLRIAASIGAGTPVDLGDALCALDGANLTLVAEAVLHAGGLAPATGWKA
jgi:hypothetical protein